MCGLLPAQRLYFNNVSNALGLPSGECYNLMQDRRGYIWIGTEAGLCRYNGSSLKIYNRDEGLPEAAVYFSKENKEGQIELISSANRILEAGDDSIRESPFNQVFQKKLSHSLEVSYSLNRDRHGNMIVNSQSSTYQINPFTHTVERQADCDTAYQPGTGNYMILDARSVESFLVKAELEGIKRLSDGKFHIKVLMLGPNGQRRIELNSTDGLGIDFRMKLCDIGPYVFFNIHNMLIRFDRKKLEYKIYRFTSHILAMYADSRNGLWIGTFQDGLFYYSDATAMQLTGRGLDNFTVSGILMDKEEGVWCSTIEKGVFYCGDRHLDYYSNIPELCKSADMLRYAGGRVLVSTNYGELFILGKDSLCRRTVPTLGNGAAADVVMMKNRYYIAGKGGLVVTDHNLEHPEMLRLSYTNFHFYSNRVDTFKGKVYGLAKNFCFRIDGSLAVPMTKGQDRVFKSLCVLNDSMVLLGSTDGLYRFNLHSAQLRRLPGISSAVIRICRRSNGSCWLATRGEGLFTLRGDQPERVLLKTSTQPAYVFDINEDRYGNLWLASNTGLIKVDAGEKVWRYSSANLLPANEVNGIAVDSSFIYLSTPEGICRLPLQHSLVNKSAPVLYSSTITVNGQLLHPNNRLVFSHQQNSLVFGFDVPVFKRDGEGLLRYWLQGLDTAWKLSRQPELRFDHLPPGSYELVVYALNNSGIRSLQPLRYRFIIREPFWQTGWFIACCLLLFLSLVFFVTRRIIRNVQHREEEKTRVGKMVAGSRLMALQARMNPHFIFNAINSIQNYILKQQEEEAYNYLAKFSKLIRMVLNNSGKNTISLHEELETLKLYIELEQLRFKNHFEFICEVAPGLDEFEASIPVMFIQPYVENAIGHGLMNLGRERRGILTLKIGIEQRLMKIVIEDNGVGRRQAGDYKKENLHRPVAMSLTEQRLDIIRRMENFEAVRAVVTDLYDGAGRAAGTRVELFLPLNI